MRTDSLLLVGSLFMASMLIIFSRPAIKQDKGVYTDKAIGQINQQYKLNLKRFELELTNFEEATQQFGSEKMSEKELRNSYKALRGAFKQVEFVLEYLDKEAYDKVLNGAPLPKLEPKVADFNILPPKGLQVIDELMAEDDLASVSEDLVYQTKKLTTAAASVITFSKDRRLTDRQFFEASRQAIVRMVTLGITGFDTPGTTMGVSDANIVLTSIQQSYQHYEGELENVRQRELFDQLNKLFNQAERQTKRSDFDGFDRLRFIKQYAQPLYAGLLEVHLALDYETIEEVSRFPLAVNYLEDNFFSENFLNPYYYVSLEDDDKVEDLEELGKMLFFDPILSSDNRMSCASCHLPEKAFTDGLRTSISNTGHPLKRNSMTLNYSVYASGYFHDMRVKRLEDQFEHVVFSEDEFDSNYATIIDKLNKSAKYSEHFESIFNDPRTKIRNHHIDYALTAYVMSLNAFDSPVDQYFQGKRDELPEEVKRGFNLFAGKAACATCHFAPLFSGTVPPIYVESESEVLGVPENKNTPLVLDDDRGRISNGNMREVAEFFVSSFKTPTVRNIDKTGPYMHNGVFDSLEEVMEFYNEGGGAGRGIVLEHQTLAPDPLELTEQEISDIIAFMKALSDETVFDSTVELPQDFSKQDLNDRSRDFN